jgi:hypothetical protein
MGGSWAAAEAKGRNSAFDLKKVTLSNKLDSLFGYIPEGWQPLARGRGRNAAETPGSGVPSESDPGRGRSRCRS